MYTMKNINNLATKSKYTKLMNYEKKNYFKSERSLCMKLTTLQVKTKLEKTMKSPAILNTILEWDRFKDRSRW